MRVLILTVITALGFSGATQAQMPGGENPGEMNSAMLRVFGDHKAFQAKADVKVTDANQKEVMNAPMEVALSEGKARFAFDLTQMKGDAMPPAALEMMKSSGMTQIVSVSRPDLKEVFIVYPVKKAMLRMPMSEKNAKMAVSEPKITKTVLGKETIDGHACVKNQVKMTDADGGVTEATTWNATDLKDFPVQIKATEKGMTSLLRFKDIRLAKPDAALFDVPSGFKEYKNMMEMMQSMMQGMGAPK